MKLMRASAYFSGLAAIAPLLVSAGFAVVEQVHADPAIPISECREQSIDQFGFDECLLLMQQQSESALIEMEANWLDKLTVNEQAAPGPAPDSAQGLDDEAGSAHGTSAKVIAIVSGNVLEDSEVLENSLVISADDTDLPDDNRTFGNSAALQAARFAELPELFRRYRGQRCEWEAGLMEPGSEKSYLLACQIALNRQKMLQLRQLLVEKNASDASGSSFRGYYVRTASGGSFQSCDRRQDWWVTGSEEVLTALQRRYDDIAIESLELVYVELRGRAGQPVETGPGADFVGALEVATLNLMRPILELDCRALPAGYTSLPVEEADDELTDNEFAELDDSADAPVLKTTGVTVDELGDAGFLYGYFSNWISACAVDKVSVCQAQTQVEYSSEGEWMFSVDRSSLSNWRVRLVPTTENHLVSGPLQLTIDNIESTAENIALTEIEVGRGVEVASGQRALDIISRLRTGQSLDIEWIRPDQVSAKVSFSLTGITRALQYFNQAEK